MIGRFGNKFTGLGIAEAGGGGKGLAIEAGGNVALIGAVGDGLALVAGEGDLEDGIGLGGIG